ncbi:XAC0095 family protein [Pseudoxanthomonas wuyuanensis]
MSKFDSDDKDMPGYFLPEDSQFRLKKLRERIEFLSQLAQPRTSDETKECAPEVRMGELEVCLALLSEQIERLLSEQIERLLEEVSRPAQRKAKAVKMEATAEADTEEDEDDEDEDEDEDEDDAPEKMQEISVAAAERYSFGVTLNQIDSLDLLTQTISAHGDVVAGSHEAEFADHTLPRIGQAIYDGVEAVRAILDEVEDQPLGPSRRPPNRVGETRAVYDAGFAHPPARQRPQPSFGDGLNRTLQ